MSPTQIELGVPKKPSAEAKKEETESFDVKEFAGGVKSEFNKISWPSKDQVGKELVAVVVLVAILSGIIFLIDIVFGKVSDFFIGNI